MSGPELLLLQALGGWAILGAVLAWVVPWRCLTPREASLMAVCVVFWPLLVLLAIGEALVLRPIGRGSWR